MIRYRCARIGKSPSAHNAGARTAHYHQPAAFSRGFAAIVRRYWKPNLALAVLFWRRPKICSGEYFFCRSFSTFARSCVFRWSFTGFGLDARPYANT